LGKLPYEVPLSKIYHQHASLTKRLSHWTHPKVVNSFDFLLHHLTPSTHHSIAF